MVNHELINPVEDKIIQQYQTVATALNSMFKEISIRTDGELWRLKDSRYFGMGSCIDMDYHSITWYLDGPARETLIGLQDLRNRQIPGESRCCPHHREGVGCILGDLKPPRCLAHVENRDELRRRFGIDSIELTHNIEAVLKYILLGRADEPFIQAAVYAANSMTEDIKKHPILHLEEVITETA